MYPAEDVVKFLKRNYKQPEDKTILDFGCGSGRNTVLMSDMGFEKIIAMDYNEDCLKLTKEKLLGKNNVEYIKNERLTISLPDVQYSGSDQSGSRLYCCMGSFVFFYRRRA